MPAIIMHAGAGVLLIIMTNFASPQPINKNTKSQITNHKSQITNSNKPPPSYPHPKHQQHKISSQNQHHNKRPAPYNKLTPEIQFFQIRKMHQT